MSVYRVKLNEEQFKVVFDAFPYDPELQKEACKTALYDVRVIPRRGVWPKYDARVYVDEGGFNSSGYLLVQPDDVGKVPGCQRNGFMSVGGPSFDEIVWDYQPERDRNLAIRETLMDWAWS